MLLAVGVNPTYLAYDIFHLNTRQFLMNYLVAVIVQNVTAWIKISL